MKLGIAILLLLSSFACWPVCAQSEVGMNRNELMALKAEVNDRLQRHYIRRRGAQDPDSISFASRTRVFLSSAQPQTQSQTEFASWLSSRMRLSTNDIHILREAASRADSSPDGMADLTARSRDLHSQLGKVGDVNRAVELGRKLNTLQDESDALRGAHNELLLAKLSKEGRRTLDDYLYREIVPRMTSVRVDYAALYAELFALTPQIKQLQASGEMASTLPPSIGEPTSNPPERSSHA